MSLLLGICLLRGVPENVVEEIGEGDGRIVYTPPCPPAQISRALRVFPTFTWFAGGESVGLWIVDKLLFNRIPGEFTAQFVANIGKVADGDGAVTCFGRADRLLAGPNAVEPVA